MTANQTTIESTTPTEPMTPKPISITCKCGSIFEWTPTQDQIDFLDIYKPKLCQSCEAELQAKIEERYQKDQEEKAAREAEGLALLRQSILDRLDRKTPERYQATDTGHPSFNLKLWNRIKTWRPTAEIPFLGLIGESGGCKTRIAYLLLREIVLESLPTNPALKGARGISFQTACVYEIAKAVRCPFSSKDSDKARAWLNRLADTELLLLDDLGKARNTPAVAEEMFGIIDQRHAENAWTIWTSNSTPEVIASGMSEDMAGPFAGRMIECSNIVTV